MAADLAAAIFEGADRLNQSRQAAVVTMPNVTCAIADLAKCELHALKGRDLVGLVQHHGLGQGGQFGEFGPDPELFLVWAPARAVAGLGQWLRLRLRRHLRLGWVVNGVRRGFGRLRLGGTRDIRSEEDRGRHHKGKRGCCRNGEQTVLTHLKTRKQLGQRTPSNGGLSLRKDGRLRLNWGYALNAFGQMSEEKD